MVRRGIAVIMLPDRMPNHENRAGFEEQLQIRRALLCRKSQVYPSITARNGGSSERRELGTEGAAAFRPLSRMTLLSGPSGPGVVILGFPRTSHVQGNLMKPAPGIGQN